MAESSQERTKEPAAARSRALDDLIMGTNSSSITSKRSVERLYYPNEPHYFRYFVAKPQRRAPLINRGYWLRLRAIDTVVRRFILSGDPCEKVVINLGCGSDVLPWQCHARYGSEACASTLFVDIDYPDLMSKKRDIVLQTPHLRSLLGQDPHVNQETRGSILLRSQNYCQLGCDLRDLDHLRETLQTLRDLDQCRVLFVAEVSITYMDTTAADALIHWASGIGKAEFCLLEQLLPKGHRHPFATTMLAHFDKLRTPPRSVLQYPTLNDQRGRFSSRGWRSVDIQDLWDIWGNCDFVSAPERAALDDVEPFDEWEEFMLFGRHYFLLHAQASGPAESNQERHVESRLSVPDVQNNTAIVMKHTDAAAPKRRFGNALVVPDPEGGNFLVHLMGLGVTSRSDSCDIFSLGTPNAPPALPLSGPPPRMCCTVTDLGDYGVLLTGGRSSPARPMADCWILQRGVHPEWVVTASLPVPLFRHSAVRLVGSSMALVAGGKTGPSGISKDYYLYHPLKSWSRCEIQGVAPEPSFGAILCNSTNVLGQRGHFQGLLSGGIGGDGGVLTKQYTWHLDSTLKKPVIRFQEIAIQGGPVDLVNIFGASVVDIGPYAAICGGMGYDGSCLGQTVTLLTVSGEGCRVINSDTPLKEDGSSPFMIGCTAVSSGPSQIALVGGGATCFSMGTFWETGVYNIQLPSVFLEASTFASPAQGTGISYLASPRMLQTTSTARVDVSSTQRSAVGQSYTAVPRVKLSGREEFLAVLRGRKPLIIEGLDLGSCVERWTPEYLIQSVGNDTQVVVHECIADTEKMDFNSKNFRYVTQPFGTFVDKARPGGRLYLRSLSQTQPSELPADLAKDFPSIADDFRLPPQIDFVKENSFSSILRISGRVNMWLHYDVMANIYAQIQGSKRMILFPPTDVSRLSFAPGASSSSLDVFSELERATGRLAGTHPHQALLHPGDTLLLPATWLHAATPITDMSVAVNVFFRDLDSGYAQGRDVYGNRDLAAYEKGRQDAARITKSFQSLPTDIRQFYLSRIADELLQST